MREMASLETKRYVKGGRGEERRSQIAQTLGDRWGKHFCMLVSFFFFFFFFSFFLFFFFSLFLFIFPFFSFFSSSFLVSGLSLKVPLTYGPGHDTTGPK